MFFTKMHGLGNNYVVFNQLEDVLSEDAYPKLARKVSDVYFGIGSDGIILICSSKKAPFKMRIFNKDGSEAKNCGNGLRCVAKFLYDKKYVTSKIFTLETLGGVVTVEVECNENEIVDYVTVDMGQPKLLKGLIPMIGNPLATAINENYTIGDQAYTLSSLSMGNPHTVMFVEDVYQIPLEEIGPKIEHADLFPERVNVSFVQVKNRQELQYRVWERGSGMTMACGTGACASVVAATLNNLVDKYKRIRVLLPGGDLIIRWDENGHVWMKGEASYICTGELDEALLSAAK